jgi:hypothetical protein
MIEGKLFAFAARALIRGRFGFAMTVRITAVFRALQHEVLLAGDATAPKQSCDQQ